ncbi:mRNA decay activator protein ZFP36L2 [Cololabis saira]|uniref:mRNA decay activator protein ZFP36L2 n=1 Tax=Cololabis saira TaxID=129043 RepID=UPI002AD54D58|nr:mRNA decay activator protein ZFP36L2 [Cololabis saira]
MREEMSATVLSAFYDMDMFYKQDKGVNMNALHINSLLDQKAVGAPLAAPGSGGPGGPCGGSGGPAGGGFAPGFFRRNSSSSSSSGGGCVDNNKYALGSYSSMKENSMNKENRFFRERAYSESAERGVLQAQKPGGGGGGGGGAQINSTRYKTELCRPFEENGACKYGEKCQFAHGYHELRSLSRHPKYKTEPCRTFHTIGFCPYGPRCHFIHNADERRPAPAQGAANGANNAEPRGFTQRDTLLPPQLGYAAQQRPKLHHSLSFSGFSSAHHGLDSPTSRTPPPPTATPGSSSCTTASSFYEEVLAHSSVSCIHSAFSSSFPGQDLKALLAPLAVHAAGSGTGDSVGHYGSAQLPGPGTGTYNMAHLAALRRLSESPPVFSSPVFSPPPSPPDSLSDRDSCASGCSSLGSSGSLSGSESPGLDAGRRLPIFSRLSISDD